MNFADGIHILSSFVLMIFWEDYTYQSNLWTTIDKRYEYFVDDYVGLGLGVHHDVVCPIQIVSIVYVFTY